jgi:hypothetical protein
MESGNAMTANARPPLVLIPPLLAADWAGKRAAARGLSREEQDKARKDAYLRALILLDAAAKAEAPRYDMRPSTLAHRRQPWYTKALQHELAKRNSK